MEGQSHCNTLVCALSEGFMSGLIVNLPTSDFVSSDEILPHIKRLKE